MGAVLYHGEPNGASLTVLAALAEAGDEAALGIAAGRSTCWRANGTASPA
jgi:hypothetical protein